MTSVWVLVQVGVSLVVSGDLLLWWVLGLRSLSFWVLQLLKVVGVDGCVGKVPVMSLKLERL